MPLPDTSRFVKPVASFLGIALLSCQISHAAPSYISLNDFQPNCDIRRLGLTPEQHNELRKIRAAFKLANDKARIKKEPARNSAAAKSLSGSSLRIRLIGETHAIMSKTAICPA